MILFKKGVDARGLKTETIPAILVAHEAYREHDTDLVITSIVDGKHKRSSVHMYGFAIDIRSKNLPNEEVKQEVAGQIRMYLGDQYDVGLEYLGEDNEHIHIEFDPR